MTYAGVFSYLTIPGSLNDFDELPGTASVVGELLNRFGTTTNPEQEFVNILHSRLPANALEDVVFPETGEDKQLFFFLKSSFLHWKCE